MSRFRLQIRKSANQNGNPTYSCSPELVVLRFFHLFLNFLLTTETHTIQFNVIRNEIFMMHATWVCKEKMAFAWFSSLFFSVHRQRKRLRIGKKIEVNKINLFVRFKPAWVQNEIFIKESTLKVADLRYSYVLSYNIRLFQYLFDAWAIFFKRLGYNRTDTSRHGKVWFAIAIRLFFHNRTRLKFMQHDVSKVIRVIWIKCILYIDMMVLKARNEIELALTDRQEVHRDRRW